MGRYGSIDVSVLPGTIHVVLRGEIDAGVADDVQQVLELGDPEGARVEIDARAVTFMDGYGLRMLAWLTARARRVVLRDPPQIVRFLLEVTDLADAVDVRPPTEHAPATPPDRHGTADRLAPTAGRSPLPATTPRS